MAELTTKLRKMPEGVTLTVTIIKTSEFYFRLWLGKLLITWAVRVWGCGVEFVGDEGQ